MEEVKADRAKLLELSIAIKSKLERQVQEVRSQLTAEQTRWADLLEELQEREKTCAKLQGQLSDRDAEIAELRSQFQAVPAQLIPDIKTAYEGYKREKKPGRTFTVSELKPFYVAILKGLTLDKGN